MFGFEQQAQRTPRTPRPETTRAVVGFSTFDKAALAEAYRAWANSANDCPLCVVQVAQIRELAASLTADNGGLDSDEVAHRLARECLRRAELQDAIALVCDGADAGTASYVRDELSERGFDVEALKLSA